MPPCLMLSNIRYISRVKLSNAGKGVVPSPTPRCSSYWKGSLLVALDYGCQLYFYLLIYYCHFVYADSTNYELKICFKSWKVLKKKIWIFYMPNMMQNSQKIKWCADITCSNLPLFHRSLFPSSLYSLNIAWFISPSYDTYIPPPLFFSLEFRIKNSFKK